MKITELDYISHRLYVDAYNKNPSSEYGIGGIDGEFVNDIEGFVLHRKQHYNNLLYYYNKANTKLRKMKIEKICNETEG